MSSNRTKTTINDYIRQLHSVSRAIMTSDFVVNKDLSPNSIKKIERLVNSLYPVNREQEISLTVIRALNKKNAKYPLFIQLALEDCSGIPEHFGMGNLVSIKGSIENGIEIKKIAKPITGEDYPALETGNKIRNAGRRRQGKGRGRKNPAPRGFASVLASKITDDDVAELSSSLDDIKGREYENTSKVFDDVPDKEDSAGEDEKNTQKASDPADDNGGFSFDIGGSTNWADEASDDE